MKTLPLLLLIMATASCTYDTSPQANPTKIKFSMDSINDQGLRGTPRSLRAVSYEFCIPDNATTVQQLQAIDPSVKLYPGSSGRINCSEAEILAIGHTHQAQWKSILFDLSSQDYIAEIQETFFE
jgi:hypothetical protein